MPAILSLLGPILPYILGALAVIITIVAGYFGIKQKGVRQERERQAVAQAKAVQQVQQKVQVAQSKDSDIDQKVQAEIQTHEDEIKVSIPSSPDKFRF